MFYEFIEFKNTIIKSYYRINIEINKNTTVASNDEQMFSDEKKSPNDQKIINQSSKLHDTEINAITFNAVNLNTTISSADALNAAVFSAFNRAESKEIF